MKELENQRSNVSMYKEELKQGKEENQPDLSSQKFYLDVMKMLLITIFHPGIPSWKKKKTLPSQPNSPRNSTSRHFYFQETTMCKFCLEVTTTRKSQSSTVLFLSIVSLMRWKTYLCTQFCQRRCCKISWCILLHFFQVPNVL